MPAGTQYVFVTVRNTSPTYCRLSGRPGLRDGPSVVATSPRESLRPGQHHLTSPARTRHGRARLTLTADNQLCRDDPAATYRHYRHLTLTWGDGQVLLARRRHARSRRPSSTRARTLVQVTPWYTSRT